LIHSQSPTIRSPHCALSALPFPTTPTPTCQKAAPRPARRVGDYISRGMSDV